MAKINATLVREYSLYKKALDSYCEDEGINYFVCPQKNEIIIMENIDRLKEDMTDIYPRYSHFYDNIKSVPLEITMNYVIEEHFYK